MLIVDLMHLMATASKLRPEILKAYETNRKKNNNNVFTTVVLLSGLKNLTIDSKPIYR